MSMELIKNIMTTDIVTASCDMPLADVFNLLTEHQISFVVICRDSQPMGVITERDIVRFAAEELDASRYLAEDVMSSPVFVIDDLNTDIAEAYHRLKLQHKRHLVVVNDDGQLNGVVTLSDFIRHLGMEAYISHKPLSQILTQQTFSVLPQTSALEAIALMVQHKISCILICDASGRPVGILTERDVGRIKAAGSKLKGRPVSELMTSPVLSVAADMNTFDATKLMRKEAVRHLVVVNEAGLLSGVVTETNIMKGIEGRYIQSLIDLLHEKDAELLQLNAALETKVAERTQALMLEIETRKASQAQIKKITQALEQAGEAVIITDPQGSIEYVNTAFTQITGYSLSEVHGRNPRLLHSGQQGALFYERMWRAIMTHGTWKGVLWNKRKNGQIYPEQLHICSAKDSNGEVVNYIGTFSDISDKVALESEFQHAKHMEAIGSLVGGVAHNFNNILSGFTGHLYLVNSKIDSPAKMQPHLKSLENLTQRAAEMVQQLLTFARKNVTEKKNIPLKILVKETLGTSRLGIPENIQLVEHYSDDKFIVHGDASQLQQVVMNLVNNARDALEEASDARISVSLKRFVATPEFMRKHAHLRGGAMVCLTVQDSGQGLSESDLAHAFDPFFSTKKQGKGTGLGLSMSRGAVESHGGIIEVDSWEGKGAEFRVYLPLLEGDEVRKASRMPVVIQGKGELVLLVDDELVVVETVAAALESIGYRVITARNGEEAFGVFMQNEQELALIITDIVMPKMGGVELMQSVRQYSDIPMVLMTGYGFDKEIVDKPSPMVILKPFSIPDLSEMLAKALQRRAA